MSQQYDVVFQVQWQLNNQQLLANLNGLKSQAQQAAINVPIKSTIDPSAAAGVANLGRAHAAAQRTMLGTAAAANQAAAAVGGMARVSVDASGAVNALSTSIGRAARNMVAYSVAAGAIGHLAGSLRASVHE